MVFWVALCISFFIFSVVSAEVIYEQDYLRGTEITTPESAGISSSAMSESSAASGIYLSSEGVPGVPVETEGIEWQLLLGGNYGDSLNDIELTGDGGYIAAGATASTSGDVPIPSLGSSDAWVVKFNSTGDIEWQKRYGGDNYDQAMSIDRTQDGGYVFTGRSASRGTHGGDDVWVVKLDRNGTRQWQSFMGGSYGDFGRSIRQTADGGYIIAGDTFSDDIETAGNDVGGIYAARLDPSGNVLWQRSIGGSGSDAGSSIIPSDSGYILAGFSDSTDFGTDQRKGGDDGYIIRLDESGTQEWLRVFGGIGHDRTGYDNVISQVLGGGYIITAQSTSGDIADNHGSFDTLVMKLNPDGTIHEDGQKKWLKMYGGLYCEVTGSITPLSEGGYILTTQASSGWSGDIPEENHGEHDIWVVRLDPEGNIIWQKLLGGNHWDQSTSIRETTDGGYIFAGFTQSSDSGYIGTSHGYEDAWVVKLKPRLAVDVIDADTNKPVYGATVYLNDVSHDEERNVTAINGHASFSDSGESLQYRLVGEGRYSVRATADGYHDSNSVPVIFSGDGQRVMVNITAMNRTIEKTFSITNNWIDIENHQSKLDREVFSNIKNGLNGWILTEPGENGNGLAGPEVTRKFFGAGSSRPSHTINDATLHWHFGHGVVNLSDLHTGLQLLRENSTVVNGNYDIESLYQSEIQNSWGGKNKWVVLQSCLVLSDPDWGETLGTTHGILGYFTTTYVGRHIDEKVPQKFFIYSKNGDSLYDSWRKVTVDIYKGVKGGKVLKDADGKYQLIYSDKINITAAVRFKNNMQRDNDHLPGYGSIEPDDLSSDKSFITTWDCGSGKITQENIP